MAWTRSPATRAILGVLAVYILMIGVLMGMRWSGLQVGSSARVGLAIAFTIPMGWLVLNYWRAWQVNVSRPCAMFPCLRDKET